MYNLEQLNSRTIEELQTIAAEMNVKLNGTEDKAALMFRIIDEQASNFASSSTSGEAEGTTRKRARVSIKNVDRVYTANQSKAKKIDKQMKKTVDDSLYGSLSEEEKSMLSATTTDEVPSVETPAAEPEAEPAPKKRGRKKKEDTPAVEAPVEAAPAPKKRGRKKKEEVAAAAEETAGLETNINTDASESAEAAPSQPVAAEPASEATPAPSAPAPQIPVVGEDSADFVPPTDGTEFIIVTDIPYIEAGASPSDLVAAQQPTAVHAPAAQRQSSAAMSQKGVQSQRREKTPAYDFSHIVKVSGVLETEENYGYLRSSDYNYLPSPDDVYVTLQQIKHWGLKMGDVVEAFVRPPRDGERYFLLVDVTRINGCEPAAVRGRNSFEFLTPLFPDEKFKLCSGDGKDSKSSRIVDLFAPIGKGQRALIVAQPKTGKTILMKDIANSIARNHPEAYLMMLLIDERPEEVTDMARTVNAEVIASTFDAPAENHVKIAGIVLEKAKRMVECGHDVVIFLDSITRLARAYNTVSPASGKVLSGGVDANALHKPKRFFGAARNIENGGSLTIIATALIDTGSKMDEVIFEEFKGTGNMELQLDRQLANKRIFPAVNLVASSTRRDDLLLPQTTLNRMWVLRKHIADMNSMEAMDVVMKNMERTLNNEEFLLSMNG